MSHQQLWSYEDGDMVSNLTERHIHLSNVLTDHFLNSLPTKTTKGIPKKFSKCPSKNSSMGSHSQIVAFIYKSFM